MATLVAGWRLVAGGDFLEQRASKSQRDQDMGFSAEVWDFRDTGKMKQRWIRPIRLAPSRCLYQYLGYDKCNASCLWWPGASMMVWSWQCAHLLDPTKHPWCIARQPLSAPAPRRLQQRFAQRGKRRSKVRGNIHICPHHTTGFGDVDHHAKQGSHHAMTAQRSVPGSGTRSSTSMW